MALMERREAFGFVRDINQGALPDSCWEFICKEGMDKWSGWYRKHRTGHTSGELEQLMDYLRAEKDPGQDAWEILLALYPEDRTFLEWYMMDRLIHTMLHGLEAF